MDSLSGLLDGPRAQRAFLLRCVLDAPWSLRIEDEAPLTVVAVVEGGGWIEHPAGTHELGPGDVLLVRGPRPYVVCDIPERPVRTVIGPGGTCTTLAGEPLESRWSLGVRTWGHDLGAETTLIVGTYGLESALGRRLLDALPELAVVAADAPVVALLGAELGREAPGQETVLDRLLDLLLVTSLRTWFARDGAQAPAWYAAHADDVVGPALRLMQSNPSAPWTIASLAREVGISRAALARRFTGLLGEGPMSFLTGWRIDLAADLLREPGATVASVAPKVGYGSPFALSTAFKRVRGVSPAAHRAAHAA